MRPLFSASSVLRKDSVKLSLNNKLNLHFVFLCVCGAMVSSASSEGPCHTRQLLQGNMEAINYSACYRNTLKTLE